MKNLKLLLLCSVCCIAMVKINDIQTKNTYEIPEPDPTTEEDKNIRGFDYVNGHGNIIHKELTDQEIRDLRFNDKNHIYKVEGRIIKSNKEITDEAIEEYIEENIDDIIDRYNH